MTLPSLSDNPELEAGESPPVPFDHLVFTAATWVKVASVEPSQAPQEAQRDTPGALL
jgi:hypothetical protein